MDDDGWTRIGKVKRHTEENKRLTFLSEFTGAEWPAFLIQVSRISYRPMITEVNYENIMNHQEPQRRPKKGLAGEAIGYPPRDSFDSRLGLLGLTQPTLRGADVKGAKGDREGVRPKCAPHGPAAGADGVAELRAKAMAGVGASTN